MTRRHRFAAEEAAALLGELDARLRERGVAASVFVVGGAAIAATEARSRRLTEDVDALTHDEVVLEEAKAMARERGLPENWLNQDAKMWMPPLPAGVLDHPGLATASPEQLEAHIRSYYTDPAALDFIVDGNDVDQEITLLAQDASRMLNRTAAANEGNAAPDAGTERLTRSVQRGQRTPPADFEPHTPQRPDH